MVERRLKMKTRTLGISSLLMAAHLDLTDKKTKQ